MNPTCYVCIIAILENNSFNNKINNNNNNSQNTKKSPGDLRRLAVTQTPVKNSNTDVKNSKGVNNDNNNMEDLKVGGRIEISQTLTLLRTARIMRRVLET